MLSINSNGTGGHLIQVLLLKNLKIEKYSRSEVNLTYLPKALANGVEFKSNFRVKKITLDKLGNANGVIYFDSR